jgi:molybdate-binding protein
LTPAGDAFLTLHQALEATLAAGWPALAKVLAQAQPLKAGAKSAVLRIHASHDFALAALRDLAVKQGLAVELHFQGSLDALQTLADGHCDVAGFHVAITPSAAAGLGPLARPLRSRSMRLIEFATRRQGLMTPHGRAARVKTLADLARNGSRFINRQPGSGTRLLFDRLLAIEGIAARDIHGYRDEEFTHAAVAATIASGKADAGFGIEAAARAQGLHFIPIATERYLLATRDATLSRPAMKNFCQLLDSPACSRVLSKLPGYAAPASHVPQRVADTVRETPASFR